MHLSDRQKKLGSSFRQLLLPGVLAFTAFGLAPAHAANILVVTGTDAPAITAGNQLNTDLGGTNTVTVVNTGVPVSLAGYTQIFDTRYDNHPSFSGGEQSQYLDFLNASPGNTIFLMGENAAFNVRNTPISAFIALAGGGVVPVPSRTVNGPEIVNPPFTGPNNFVDTGNPAITYAACGLVTSAGTGAFATQQVGGGCAIYFGVGTLANALQGALVVVYDVNFIYDPNGRLSPPNTGVDVDGENPFRLNLEQFASDPTTPPTVTSVTPGSGSTAGGNPITITGTGFTGATDVTIRGAPATDVVVVDDTSITAMTPAGSAGTASVVVSTPDGINADNTLYTYISDQLPNPPLQLSLVAPVTLQVIQNELLVTPGSAIVLSNRNDILPWQATTATPWLTLTQAQGELPARVDMTANASGLNVGSYQGTVTVTSYDPSSGRPIALSVPVALTVLPPASLTANPAVLPSAFGYPLGSATGYDVQIGGPGMPFTAQTSPDSSSWLSINPASGVGPATVHVVIDPSQGTYGTYQDNIVITSPGAPNSPLVIPVRMILSSFMLTLPQQVNAATGAGPDRTVAPNEMVSLYLSDFSCSSQPVVSINGAAVPWSAYVPGQINYSVPANVTAPALLSVACNGSTVWSFNSLNVAATVPGVLTSMNADGTVNGGASAARRGSYASVYVTGFGAFDTASDDGRRRLAGTVTALIGGSAATVQYAGEAPGYADGMQQINLLIPADSPVGAAVPLTLFVNGTPTQTTATIAVN